MDIGKVKLIYSEKFNQFYKPIRLDEDIETIYMMVANNRHDKSIKKEEIIRIEENINYKYIIMHDFVTTAEQHFINVMESDCSPHIKINEIKDFNKNMLAESETCVTKLKEIAYSNPLKADQYAVIMQKNAILQYKNLNIWKNCLVEENRKSYENQVIPAEIIHIALSKRLFIERRDETCKKGSNSNKRKTAPSLAKRSIQSNFPCGFLIKDKGGYIVAGKSGNQLYTLSVKDVIDFVREYDDSKTKNYSVLYQVPISKRKKNGLAKCYNILKEHGLYFKNEHNYFFWVLDKRGNTIAGEENGFGFKQLLKYCKSLQIQSKNQN